MDNKIKPRLALMDEEQVAQVHGYALRILSETGVRVESPAVLQKLQRTGQVHVEGRTAKISPGLVEAALRSAPREIPIFNRRGEPAFTLGDGTMRFGIGVTALYYIDPLTDQPELFARRHIRDLTRLGGLLPHFDAISTVGIPRDVPPHLSDLYTAVDMISHTTKPLVMLVSDESKFPAVIDLFEELAGDLAPRPFIIPYFNPVSPLVYDAGTLNKMTVAVERGLPFILSSYSMAGMSSPMTPAGILAMLTAEQLAGLTISQVLEPGTPVVLGFLPNYFDMKTLQSFYDPQSILLNLACADMLAHYGIPHCGTSGSGTGWGTDLISADTYWANTLTFTLTRGGFAPFVGDTLGAKAFAPTTVVYVHEIIDQAKRIADGFALDDDSSVLDEIAAAGPGGSFLSARTTKQLYKTGYYRSPMWPRWSIEKWQSEGMPDAKKLLRERTCALLESAPAPDDCDELMRKGEEIIGKIK
ncbi:MAG TPA: trimethylamine methyltransferase family protein [Anaerolineales bacterium]|nr:trimethylamine methyltransferase family protein [Anaerolineales bacterium]